MNHKNHKKLLADTLAEQNSKPKSLFSDSKSSIIIKPKTIEENHFVIVEDHPLMVRSKNSSNTPSVNHF